MEHAVETSSLRASCRLPAGLAETPTFTAADPARSAAYATLVQDAAARRAALTERLRAKGVCLQVEGLSDSGFGRDSGHEESFILDVDTVYQKLTTSQPRQTADDIIFGPEFVEHVEPFVYVMSESDGDEGVEWGQRSASLWTRFHHMNRFAALELVGGTPIGPPPGLSRPSWKERKRARQHFVVGRRSRSLGAIPSSRQPATRRP
jgi:hypothetical protein